MKRRVSSALALGITLLSLLAGALAGIFLRSESRRAGGVPAVRRHAPGIEEPSVRPPAPAPAESGNALSSAAPSVPSTAARLRAFGTWCRQIRASGPKGDLHRIVTPAEVKQNLDLQRSACDLRKTMKDDPEGYLSALRSPENEKDFRGLLSLLCQWADPDGGNGLFPLKEIPGPILDGLRELFRSGTPNQKLGILALIQRSFTTGPQSLDLIGEQALVEQCSALLADADPRLRVSAAGMLQTVAPLREDRRFEVLQEIWQSSTDSQVRCQCLSVLGQMRTPASCEFLLKGMSQIASDGTLAQDAELGGAVLNAMRTGTWSDVKPGGEDLEAAICSSALRTVSAPERWDAWLGISLDLPLTRAVPILEQAAAFAPTLALQASANLILAKIRAGETRYERLRWDRN